MSKPKPNSDRWLFYLPNDASGHAFLNTMKAIMNTGRYSFRSRGRMPDHDKVREQYPDARSISVITDYSVPMGVADMMAIYLIDRYDESRTSELWDKNYKLRQENEQLHERSDVRESRIMLLEKQVSELEEEIQTLNIEASYDDLQQEYRYNPANDTIKVNTLKHSQVVLNATVKENEQLRKQVENQRATIKVFQEKDKIYHDHVNEVSRLRHNYQKKDEHVTKLINDKLELECQVNALKNRGTTGCSIVQQVIDDLKTAVNQENEHLKHSVGSLQDRNDLLERTIQTAEKESAGLTSVLQTDMRDLDIPISD